MPRSGRPGSGAASDRPDRGTHAGTRRTSPAMLRHPRTAGSAQPRRDRSPGRSRATTAAPRSTRSYSSSTRYSKPRTARPVTTPVRAASRMTSRERRTSSRSSSLRTSNESGRRALIIRRRHTRAQCTAPEIARSAWCACSSAVRRAEAVSGAVVVQVLVDRATQAVDAARPSAPSRAAAGPA